MNFISTFDELNKLYEEVETQEKIAFMDFTGSSRQFKDAYEKRMKADGFDGEVNYVEDTQMKALCDAVNSGADVTLYTCDDDYKVNCKSIVGKKNFKVVTIVTERIEEACTKEELTEAAKDEETEIVDDEVAVEEAPAEETIAEEEPKQVICECDKCGALVIKDEADIIVDEDTDLVNVEDECQFCEEANGYKIVGVVAPYEAAEEAPVDEASEEPVEEEEIFEEAVEAVAENEEDIIDEDLADWYRKKFDKPASVRTQQAWEDELNGEMGEISDKRRKHLEKKFAQQRDWEARHANDNDDEELEELFDIKPSVSLGLHGGSGNDVSVLGH